MSFPAPSVIPPTFVQWPSVWFNGIAFGPAPYFLRGDGGIDGVFMPDVNSGDATAPRVHGQWIGLDTLGGRDITLTLDIGPPFGSYGNLAGAQAALRAALTPSGTTELPLFIALESGSQLVAMVRPRKRDSVIDIAYAVGALAQKVPIQFHATDPMFYAAGTLASSVGVPGPLGGFSFPLIFPLSFGGGTEYGTLSATNYGDMPLYPILTVTGPCTYPKILNASLPNMPFVQFAVTLNAGDQFIINTDPKYPSAVYWPSNSSAGTSYLFALLPGSSPWALAPGTNNLQFTTLDSAPVSGYLTVEYTSAYSAVA